MIEFKDFDESWGSGRGFDITPMLDMIFILLIFFLLTASIANPVVSVDLPETEVSEKSAQQEIVVSIDAQGGLFLNAEPVAAEVLGLRLNEIYGARTTDEIFIESDSSIDFGVVVNVMDICRQSGAGAISFIVDEK